MKSSAIPLRSRVAALAAASLLTLLAACGGGGGASDDRQSTNNRDVSSGTTGSTGSTGAGSTTAAGTATPLSVSGTVTGFGSVIIDGVRYDDSEAAVGIDNGLASRAASLGELKLGMSVDARVEGGKLKDVTVRATLAGPVGGIDPSSASFTIHGQTVKVVTGGATPTLFEGVANLDGLALNDRVEVHGTVDTNRVVQATRVERKPREADEPAVRLGGTLRLLDTVNKTFRLNDLTVYYADASLLPAGASLADGQQVVVFGDTAPAASRFYPKAVRVKAASDGALTVLGGKVASFVSLADFKVSGVAVDASSASVEGGVAADVADGAAVAVEGTVAAGVLKATRLRVLKSAADALASLKGEITDFVSSSSFRLRGVAVDAASATFVGGQARDLGSGARVLVEGRVSGDHFLAERVEFLSLPAAQVTKLGGEIRDWDATARSFKLMTVTVRVGEGVSFEGGTAESLANGRRVAVVGTTDSNGQVVATRIAFQSDLVATVSVVGGRAYDATTYRFKLPNVGVNYTDATVIEGGTAADIVNGALVFAKGRFDPATRSVNATWIEVVKADAAVPRVAGPVSGFASTADFRIGGQRVDASGATWIDGTASDLANGAVVMATGTLVDRDGARVLVATKLRFMQ